jgi:hypothetical protein
MRDGSWSCRMRLRALRQLSSALIHLFNHLEPLGNNRTPDGIKSKGYLQDFQHGETMYHVIEVV